MALPGSSKSPGTLLTVLFSSAGRRVELIHCFRSAAKELGAALRVVAVDLSPELSAACAVADRAYPAPPCGEPAFIDALLEICAAESVKLLVPTIDPELQAIADHRSRFETIGTVPAISSSEVVRIARDKMQTHAFLREIGLASPHTTRLQELLQQGEACAFPLILKPREGSGSRGLQRIDSLEALRATSVNAIDYIAQEYLAGKEYTVNLFFDRSSLRCAVPHLRIQTRGGEVAKARTVRPKALGDIAARLGSALAGRAYGALCFQAIETAADQFAVVELNARFGGGYPLADRAGATFARWLLEPLLGVPSTAHNNWQEDLTMLRYDSSLFIQPDSRGHRIETSNHRLEGE